jgi:hypothetical protein
LWSVKFFNYKYGSSAAKEDEKHWQCSENARSMPFSVVDTAIDGAQLVLWAPPKATARPHLVSHEKFRFHNYASGELFCASTLAPFETKRSLSEY